MGQTADQLRQDVDATRNQAADKIDQIEQKVGQATQQVKEKFDWRRQVDDNPLLALGAAMIGGMVLGAAMGGDDGDSRDRGYQPSYAGISGSGPYGRQSSSSGGGLGHMLRQTAKSTGFEDSIQSMSSAIMATMTDRIREFADRAMPGAGEKLGASSANGGQNDWRSTGASTRSTLASTNSSMSGSRIND